MKKLKGRDINQYKIVMKKINKILETPNHSYKELRYDLKGKNRVHIGHFVLVFSIDHSQKRVLFDDYDHHDNIYE